MTRQDFTTLPSVLKVAADVGGLKAAVDLARAYGGQVIYVPEKITAKHPFALALGMDVAKAIAKEYARITVPVPKGHSLVALYDAAEMLDGGKPINEVVRATGLTYRHIQRLKASLKGGNSLLSLVKDARPAKQRQRDPRQLDIDDFLTSDK